MEFHIRPPYTLSSFHEGKDIPGIHHLVPIDIPLPVGDVQAVHQIVRAFHHRLADGFRLWVSYFGEGRRDIQKLKGVQHAVQLLDHRFLVIRLDRSRFIQVQVPGMDQLGELITSLIFNSAVADQLVGFPHHPLFHHILPEGDPVDLHHLRLVRSIRILHALTSCFELRASLNLLFTPEDMDDQGGFDQVGVLVVTRVFEFELPHGGLGLHSHPCVEGFLVEDGFFRNLLWEIDLEGVALAVETMPAFPEVLDHTLACFLE